MTMTYRPKAQRSFNVVGLIPMAGQGTRLRPIPCSKELLPIGYRVTKEEGGMRPKVAAEYLIEKMKLAGVAEAFLILRKGKWDIPAYFGNGSDYEMRLAYLMMDVPYGPPYSMDEAYTFVRDRIIAFGFADILFQPDDAFVQLLERQGKSRADIILGLLNAYNPEEMDMVEIDRQGLVHGIVLKPGHTDLKYAWICAVWNGAFTEFLHEFLAIKMKNGSNRRANKTIDASGDLPLGAVIQAAIKNGLSVEGVIFPQGGYADIGTPKGLLRAVQSLSGQSLLRR
jgi:glucose-1-phosphate thymidylyltransferase